jgi:phosphate transport system permease protein/phosphate transport system substrate-binding protein
MDIHGRTFYAWLVVGMLLVSVIPVAMSAEAYAQSTININGAGASFPFPLIDTWRVEYKNVVPNINLNYQSIGSGGGIAQFTATTVDFGATDAPLTSSQTSALPGPAVHIPETIGSVVVVYNVIGVPSKGLKLTGPILADIFLGEITRWDDYRIKEINPGVPLPSKDILVVHRSDGSGTTFVWTSYLSEVSEDWNSQVGKGTAVPWPTGIGAPGNEGVANAVRGTSYTIGYVELAYAQTTGMAYAYLENSEGNFIEPTLESTAAAVAASSGDLPAGDEAWTNVSLLNAPGEESYPLASFSYLLLYKELSTMPTINSMEKAKAVVDLVEWMITDGQEFAPDLHYVPLPDAVVALNMETLAMLTYNGELVLTTDEEQPKEEPEEGSEEEPEEQPAAEEFDVSTTLDGESYEVTGTSDGPAATSMTINPNMSVEIEFDGPGKVELTLPTSMIDGITTVMADGEEIDYETVSENNSSTTISFEVPEDGSVEIVGQNVVPEFGVIAALVLAASLVGIVAFARMGRLLTFGGRA